MNTHTLTPNTNTAAQPQSPSQYQRRVLLAVSGLSPQILTETLYALAFHQDEPFIPTEVHLITTREGAQKAELSLLSKDLGWFHRLCKDYNLEGISFSKKNIHVMRDAHGNDMDDIRSIDDNRACADFITARVREFSADPDCALHVSIAGGRKTMGFYLGYALSLYGRWQDRLSHVLVSAPFESSFDFFYPTPYSRVIEVKDQKLVDTAMAEVTLAEIPFVSLRHGLSNDLLLTHGSYSEAVQAVRAALAPPELLIDLARHRVRAGGKIIDLPISPFTLLVVFAQQTIHGAPPLPAPSANEDAEWAERFGRATCLIKGLRYAAQDRDERFIDDRSEAFFSQTKSKLHNEFRQALGNDSHPYRIHDGDTRPRRYSLNLPPHAIKYVSDLPAV